MKSTDCKNIFIRFILSYIFVMRNQYKNRRQEVRVYFRTRACATKHGENANCVSAVFYILNQITNESD